MPSKVFTERPSGAVSSRADWGRLTLGLASIYALFQWSALRLGSDRGQAGLLVAAIVVTGTLFVEYAWSRRSMSSLLRVLGLGRPRRQGLAMAFAVSVLVLLTAPTYALITGASFTMRKDWLSLVPGLFAQAGVAEETLFAAISLLTYEPAARFGGPQLCRCCRSRQSIRSSSSRCHSGWRSPRFCSPW